MRIAFQDGLPNYYCAERELLQRLTRAADNLGWSSAIVRTSDEIQQFDPDCALATLFTSPKLTEHPSLGLITFPPEYLRLNCYYRTEANVLSHDGYLTCSDKIRRYLRDFTGSTPKTLSVSPFDFHLSCPQTGWMARDLSNPRRLCYVGARWDKNRHAGLLEALVARIPIDAYGPEKHWSDLPEVYRGRLPFDGIAVLNKLRESGAALCIHSREHRCWDIPTMRVWEAVAAGAVVLTDAVAFGQKHFGNSLLYLDLDQSTEDVAEQVRAHFAWIDAHPKQAQEMTRHAHDVFTEKFSLERLLEELPSFLKTVRQTGHFEVEQDSSAPAVEYVVRAGTRSSSFFERAVESLDRQTYRNVGLIVVQLGNEINVAQTLAKHKDRFASVKVVPAPANGMRSNALWEGLRAVTAPYFGMLDDDDVLHCNHVASVMALLQSSSEAQLAHSTGVRVQEEPGYYEDEPHFKGPLNQEVLEPRRLYCFHGLDRKTLLQAERSALSCSWIAHRSLLDETVLEDPHLPMLEDLYLLCRFLERTRAICTWRPTAQWYWRSASQDNVTFDKKLEGKCLERLRALYRWTPDFMEHNAQVNWQWDVEEQLKGKQKTVEFLYEQLQGKQKTVEFLYEQIQGLQQTGESLNQELQGKQVTLEHLYGRIEAQDRMLQAQQQALSHLQQEVRLLRWIRKGAFPLRKLRHWMYRAIFKQAS